MGHERWTAGGAGTGAGCGLPPLMRRVYDRWFAWLSNAQNCRFVDASQDILLFPQLPSTILDLVTTRPPLLTHPLCYENIGKYILRTKRTPVSLVRAAHALQPYISLRFVITHNHPQNFQSPSIGRVNLRQQRASCHGGRRMRQTSWAISWGYDWRGCGGLRLRCW